MAYISILKKKPFGRNNEREDFIRDREKKKTVGIKFMRNVQIY